MYRNNKLFRKIVAPYVENSPADENSKNRDYPALVVDLGDDYVVSSITYKKDANSDFRRPFSFDFEYEGHSIHEENVTNVSFCSHVDGLEGVYVPRFVPGSIFDEKELADFCLLIYKASITNYSGRQTVVVYRNFDRIAELKDVDDVRFRYYGPFAPYAFKADGFGFVRNGAMLKDGFHADRFALKDGVEISETERMSFSKWNELFSDSENSYCDFKNLYSPDNALPYDSDELKCDDERPVKWRCVFGHSWKVSVSELVKSALDENSCPECRRRLVGLSPRLLEYGAELVAYTVKSVMDDFGTEDLGKLKGIVEKELKATKKQLDHAMSSDSPMWIDEESMPKQIRYYFTHPAGKQADVDMYICENCGTVEEIGDFLYLATIPSDCREELVALVGNTWIGNEYRELLKDKYPKDEIRRVVSNADLSDFLARHHLFFKYKRLSTVLRYMTTFSLNPQEEDRELLPYEPKTKTYRNEIYDKVVYEGKSSGRWTSEQSLYRLVKTFFPDATYQYHASWLGAQSIDVYVPSIQVGLEYQGVQHYEEVEIFGGEEGLKERKTLDAKKRRLCKKNGLTLLEWKYTKEITRQAVYDLLYEWIRKTDMP